MSEYRPATLDCKVRVRKYVLVAQPSRWNQRGERIVVQSPMLEIHNAVSLVPVKRYHSEEQNSICFIPIEDIEMDSSIVYERLQVTKTPSLVDSHGVALFENSAIGEFNYRRGDQFWICVGHDTNLYLTTVPVINLRTFEKGIVNIDQVCWYPKIRGPDNELWTPGGEVKILKLCGSKNFTYFSWIICQRLPQTGMEEDVADLASTTKSVKLPMKDSRIEDTAYLSLCESRNLFKKRLSFMERNYSHSFGSISNRAQGILELPTPSTFSTPSSPPKLGQTWMVVKETNKSRSYTATDITYADASGSQCPWERLPKPKSGCDLNSSYVYKNNLIHPRELLVAPQKRRHVWPFGPPIVQHDNTQDNCSKANPDPPPKGTPDGRHDSLYNSSTALLAPAYCETTACKPSKVDATSLVSATMLLDIFREVTPQLAVSVTSPAIIRNHTFIYDSWCKNASLWNRSPIFKDLCDRGEVDCEYNTLFSCKHFHSPPEKCLFSPSNALYLREYSGQYDTTQTYAVQHEHCISRLSPFPSGIGECMLATLPSRHHKCCHWSDQNLTGLEVVRKRGYDKVALIEHRKKNMRIVDRRSWIDGRLGMDQSVCLRGCDDVLGEQGRRLKMELDEGALEIDLEADAAPDKDVVGDALCEELGLSPSSSPC
jgi:hypothetical protein